MGDMMSINLPYAFRDIPSPLMVEGKGGGGSCWRNSKANYDDGRTIPAIETGPPGGITYNDGADATPCLPEGTQP
jgi:hypothetical protein